MHDAGFCGIHRVGNFNLFSDASSVEYGGYAVSLNMIATRCTNTQMNSDSGIEHDGFQIGHNADKYDPTKYK